MAPPPPQVAVDGGQPSGRADVPVIEERQPAIAVAEERQGAAHARDGVLQPIRRRRLLGDQLPQVKEVAQHLQVVGGRALVMPAVGEHLPGHLMFEKGFGACAGLAVETALHGDQRLEVLDEMVAADIAFHHPRQMARLPIQGVAVAIAKRPLGAIQDERSVTQPRIHPERQGIGMPGDGVGPRVGGHPVVHEGASAGRGLAAADGLKVGQPLEIMEREAPQKGVPLGPPIDGGGHGVVAAH